MIRCISFCEPNSYRRNTLQRTNISPKNDILKMIFLFPRWDMLSSLEGICKNLPLSELQPESRIPQIFEAKTSGEIFSLGAQVKGAWTQKPKIAMAKCSKSRNSETGGKVQHILRFFSSKNWSLVGWMMDVNQKDGFPMVDGSGIFTDP